MVTNSKPQRIFKPQPKTQYFAMRNKEAQRSDLSYEALGLLTYLISLPDDWEINVTSLQRASFAGRDKVRRMVKELLQAGYLRLVQVQDDKGRFSNTYYEAYGIPEDNPDYNPDYPEDNRVTENPLYGLSDNRVSQQSDNHPQQKKYNNKGKKERKEIKEIPEKAISITVENQNAPLIYLTAIYSFGYTPDEEGNIEVNKKEISRISKTAKDFRNERLSPGELVAAYQWSRQARKADMVYRSTSAIIAFVRDWRKSDAYKAFLILEAENSNGATTSEQKSAAKHSYSPELEDEIKKLDENLERLLGKWGQ